MRPRFVLAAFVVIASAETLFPGFAAWAAPPEDIVAAVDEIADGDVKSGAVVGLSIGIAKGDEVILAKGYGYANAELQVPATAGTVYRVGSITKQFTAAAVLLLAEDGKVQLDDPLTKFLPEFPAQEHEVTLRHLLTHTSGIQSFTDLPSYRRLMRHDVRHDDIVARFKDEPFHFKPGEKYRYCNSGFYLLGMVVEQVSDATYEEFLEQNVFSPLQLKQTFYDRPEKIIPGRAYGYSRSKGKLRNAGYLSMTQPYAAGALASTVEDLIRWQRALSNNRLLNADSYQKMTTPAKLNDGKPISYGLGTVLRKSNGRQTTGHNGGINGFRSSLIYYPESDYTIVVLANSDFAPVASISKRIAEILFADQ